MSVPRVTGLLAIFVFLIASTAAGVERPLAARVLAELNVARTSPSSYVKSLRELRRTFRGKLVRPPGSPLPVVTEEGIAAVDEAIAFLSRQRPLRPLSASTGLKKAANDLVEDQGRSGTVGHEGLRRGGMLERMERHGKWTGRIGENISYGPSHPRLVVMSLIIDDGVTDRGHRANIFDPSFRTVGVACGLHSRFRTMCVMDFATEFRNRKK